MISWPTTQRNLVQVSAQHEVLKEKAKLKSEIDNLFALEEERLIGQAKRDQELDDIEDESLKLEAQQKIEDLRSEMNKQLKNQSVIDGGTFGQDQQPRLTISGFRKGSEGNLEIKNIGTQPARNIEVESVETEKGEIPNGLSERFPIAKLLPGGTYPVPLYISFGSASDFKIRLSWERPDGSRSEEDFFCWDLI